MQAPPLINNHGERGSFILPLGNPPTGDGKTEVYDDFTCKACAWTLTAHEGRPGHELQFSAMVEHGVSLARSLFAFNSVNVEGWALYAEFMMVRYEPPAGQMIALQLRMLRAARAMLDPMLNLGLITRERAHDILVDDVGLSEAFAREELDRFTFRSPGQATAYFYGYTRLLELRMRARSRARQELRSQGAQRFHARAGVAAARAARGRGRIGIPVTEESGRDALIDKNSPMEAAMMLRILSITLGALLCGVATAQAPGPAVPAVPEIKFHSVPDFLKLPADLYFGEVSGVAVNSKHHVFVFSRGNTTGPAYAASAAQLFEFGADGKFVREIGHNLYAWSYAHTVKVDPHDNIWVTDKGSDMVVKFTPEGRVAMVFGRKQEASDEDTSPIKKVTPPKAADDGYFRQVTDVAWDAADNTYISDGYINSRVGKVDKDGNWLMSWGEPGDKPGQFNTPHSIAVDAEGKVYVADRGNRRIQVFDGDGKFLREMTIDVPVDAAAHHAIGSKATQTASSRKAGFAVGDLHHATATPGAVRGGRVPRPHLQDDARGQGTRHARHVGQATRAVRLDPRDGLPVRERTVCCRDPQLARTEAPARTGSMTGMGKATDR